MARLFGTDGVRGLANVDLTAELALGLSVAAARVLGRAGRDRATRGRWSARDPRASGEFLSAAVVAGLASAGVDVLDVGVAADPGAGPPGGRHRRRLRRDAVRLAQPDARQRAEVLRPRRHQAARRRRGRRRARLPRGRRAPARPAPPSAASTRGPDVEPDARTPTSRTCSPPCRHPARWRAARRRRLRQRRRQRDLARGCCAEAGARVTALFAAPDGLNINDGCRLDAPRAAAGRGPRARRRHRPRPRRRRRPLPRRGRRRRHRRRRPDHGRAHPRPARPRAAHRRHPRRHGDEQPRAALAMQREGVDVVETGVGDRYVLEALSAGGFEHRRRADRPRRPARARDDGRRRPHGAAPAGPDGRDRPQPGRPRRGRAAAAAGPGQRRGVDKSRAGTDEGLLEAVAAAERELGGHRPGAAAPSGTEPLVRVMVEAARTGHAQASPTGSPPCAPPRSPSEVGRARASASGQTAQPDRRTEWSGALRSTQVARPRVGRTFSARFGSLIRARSAAARSRPRRR